MVSLKRLSPQLEEEAKKNPCILHILMIGLSRIKTEDCPVSGLKKGQFFIKSVETPFSIKIFRSALRAIQKDSHWDSHRASHGIVVTDYDEEFYTLENHSSGQSQGQSLRQSLGQSQPDGYYNNKSSNILSKDKEKKKISSYGLESNIFNNLNHNISKKILSSNPRDDIQEKDKVANSKTSDAEIKGFGQWSLDEFRAEVFKHDFPADMLEEFYAYWTEPSKTGIPKFKLQQTWRTSGRLSTWARNNRVFNTERNYSQKPNQPAGYITQREKTHNMLSEIERELERQIAEEEAREGDLDFGDSQETNNILFKGIFNGKS